MPDDVAPIEGQYHIGSDGNLTVVKRDYEVKQVGQTKEESKDGKIVKESKPIFESVPVGNIYDSQVRLPRNRENRIRAMMTIRDKARDLLSLERTGESDADVENKRAQLRAMHTEFVRRFGNLNDATNANLFARDPDAAFMQSLEVQRGGKWYGSDIFTRRQLQGIQRPAVQDVASAMTVVMDEQGRLDFDRMGTLLNRPGDEVRTELAEAGYIYHNPDDGSWETSDVYLAGSVRGKLQAARDAASNNPNYTRNVAELEKSQPEKLSADEISIHLGASWIPEEYITEWYHEAVDRAGDGRMRFQFDPVIGQWVKIERPTRANASTEAWGIPDLKVTAERILDSVMANRVIVIETKGLDGKKRKDPVATLAAQTQAQRMKNSFEQWIRNSPERAAAIEEIYNTKMNDIRTRTYEGSHQTFPGMEINWQKKIHDHQRDAVFRTVQDGTALLAHEVGFGKTLSMAASAMERKRLELSDKPVFVMPKNVHTQFRDNFYQYYPDAKILFPEDKAFSGRNKAQFLARTRDGDWDAVVLTMEQFKAIPVRPEVDVWWQEDHVAELQRRSDELLAKMKEERRGGDAYNRFENIRTKVNMALKTENGRLAKKQIEAEKHYGFDGNANTIYFEDLGVDQLYVDEADNYKNLGYESKLGNVKGLPHSESGRSWDMFMKAQIVQGNARSTAAQTDPGTFSRGGVVFATGTPVANTIAETWTMMRYLQLNELRKRDMHNFDSWAANYGKVVTDIEQTPQGTYRDTSRFSSFNNLPELSKLFQRVSDVRVASEVPKMMAVQPRLIDEKGNPKRTTVKAPAYPALAAYVKDLEARADAMPTMDPSEDNMLKLSSDARKASLDIRMVDWPEHMRVPQDPNPEGKIQLAAKNVAKIYKDEEQDKGTQIVFMDLGTPRSTSGKDKGGEDDKGDDDDVVMSAEDDEILRDAYAVLREDLKASGVPEDQVVFIHDHQGKDAQAALFERVRQGETRILVGSTAKLGVGVNIQDRAAAVHHIDVPWRPRDLEQREGRIVRQGNKVYGPVIDEATREILHPGRGVRIYQYVQEGSFDEFMWQGVEKKGIAIKALMKRHIIQREVEDVDPLVMGAAEAKALSSGDKRVGRLVDLKQKITKLRLERSSFESTQRNANNRIGMLEDRAIKQASVLPGLRKDSELAIKLTETEPTLDDKGEAQRDKDGKIVTHRVFPFGMTVGRETFTNRMEAGAALVEAIKGHTTIGEWKTLGAFHGLRLEAYNGGNYHQLALTNPEIEIQHESAQLTADTAAPRGVMSRVDNILNDMIGAADEVEDKLKKTNEDIQSHRETTEDTFEKQDELGDLEAQGEIIQGHLTENPEASSEEVQELLGDVHVDAADSAKVNPNYNPPVTRSEVIGLQAKLLEAVAKTKAEDDEAMADEGVEVLPTGPVDLGTIDTPGISANDVENIASEVSSAASSTGADSATVDVEDSTTGEKTTIEVKKEDDGDFKIQPTDRHPHPYCLCGCGGTTNPKSKTKSKFRQGHDAAAKSFLTKVENGTLGGDAIPPVLVTAAAEHPDLFVGKWTAADITSMAGGGKSAEKPSPTSSTAAPGVVNFVSKDDEPGISAVDIEDAASEASSVASSAGADSATANVTDADTGEKTTIEVKREEDGDFKIQPTAKNKFPYCLCGCGATTSVTAKFKPGHDAMLKSLMDKVGNGALPSSALPAVLLDAIKAHPDLTIGKYSATDLIDLRGEEATPEDDKTTKASPVAATATVAAPVQRPPPTGSRKPYIAPVTDPDEPSASIMKEASAADSARAAAAEQRKIHRDVDDLIRDYDRGKDPDRLRSEDIDDDDEDIRDDDDDIKTDDEDIKVDDEAKPKKARPSRAKKSTADDDVAEDEDDEDDEDDYFGDYHYREGTKPSPGRPAPASSSPKAGADDGSLVGKNVAFRVLDEVVDEYDDDDYLPPRPKKGTTSVVEDEYEDPSSDAAIDAAMDMKDEDYEEEDDEIEKSLDMDRTEDDDEYDYDTTDDDDDDDAYVPDFDGILDDDDDDLDLSADDDEDADDAIALGIIGADEKEDTKKTTDASGNGVEIILDADDEDDDDDDGFVSSKDTEPIEPTAPSVRDVKPDPGGLDPNETDAVIGRVTERITEDLNEDKEDNGVSVITSEALDSMIVEETKDEGLLAGVSSVSSTGPTISLDDIPDAVPPAVKVDDMVESKSKDKSKDKNYGKSMVNEGSRGNSSPNEPRYQQRGGRGKLDFRK